MKKGWQKEPWRQQAQTGQSAHGQTQKFNWNKKMAAVHGIVSTVSIEERGDSLRRVIDSKCPWSNHLSNLE
jgi:hypothetical protein